MKTDDYIVIMSTVSSQLEAGRIGEILVNSRLAACVNIVPGVTSYYRWGGETHTDKELIILVKTSRANYDKVQDTIREHHSYELPEVVALPIVEGSEQYLEWLGECFRSDV